MDTKKLISIKDIEAKYGLKKSYIYKIHCQGKISGYKPFGKMLWFDNDEIDAIFRSNKTFSAKESEIEANTYSITKKA